MIKRLSFVLLVGLTAVLLMGASPKPTDRLVSGVHPRLHAAVNQALRADLMGDRFCKIGDSNTFYARNLTQIDTVNLDLADYSYLSDAVDTFEGSFGRSSWAANGGFTVDMLMGATSYPQYCGSMSWVECELDQWDCMYALVLVGSADALYSHTAAEYRTDLDALVDQLQTSNVIPVLFTLPRLCNAGWSSCSALIDQYNAEIEDAASDLSLPLVDLHEALEPLTNWGLSSDKIHFSYGTLATTANFNSAYMGYGANERNRVTLQALHDILDVLD